MSEPDPDDDQDDDWPDPPELKPEDRACELGDVLRLVAPLDTHRKRNGPVTHTEPNGQVYKACRLIGFGWDFRLIPALPEGRTGE